MPEPLTHPGHYAGPIDPATAVPVRIVRTTAELREIARQNRQQLEGGR